MDFNAQFPFEVAAKKYINMAFLNTEQSIEETTSAITTKNNMALKEEMQKDYPLIPMSDVSDEARLLAVAWHENASDWIGDKHKLASDIMNYARRSNKELIEALEEIVRISDRKHDAWDNAKAALAKVGR